MKKDVFKKGRFIMEKLTAQKCTCGAITVFDNSTSESWSMRPSVFDRVLRGRYRFSWLNNSYCCNHCVNHWGIDLCNCGSGEKTGKCKGGLDDCESNTPAQVLFEEKELVMWR
jgi:hypothetical protein